jgi:hypothetical protein
VSAQTGTKANESGEETVLGSALSRAMNRLRGRD